MADPEGRKRARLLKSGPHNQGDETNPIVSAGRTFGGFLPKKKPAQSGAGRVGEGSHRAALKTRNPPGGFRRAYFCTLIITRILQTRRSKCQWLTLRPPKPFDHCGESRGCPRGCGTLRWRSKIAPGVSAPGHPQTNGEGAGATRLPWPVSFQNASQRPFP